MIGYYIISHINCDNRFTTTSGGTPGTDVSNH